MNDAWVFLRLFPPSNRRIWNLEELKTPKSRGTPKSSIRLCKALSLHFSAEHILTIGSLHISGSIYFDRISRIKSRHTHVVMVMVQMVGLPSLTSQKGISIFEPLQAKVVRQGEPSRAYSNIPTSNL